MIFSEDTCDPFLCSTSLMPNACVVLTIKRHEIYEFRKQKCCGFRWQLNCAYAVQRNFAAHSRHASLMQHILAYIFQMLNVKAYSIDRLIFMPAANPSYCLSRTAIENSPL